MEVVMHYFYVLEDEEESKKKFYFGFTSDLRQRFKAHNEGFNTSTRGRKWRLIYYEAYLTKKAAMRRERQIKRDGSPRNSLIART